MQSNSVHSTTRGRVGLFLCLLTGAGWAAPAQTVKDEPTDVAVLRAEVQRLALELLQSRAELIQLKMELLGTELQQVQGERQRLAGERQLIEREIGELNQASTNQPGAEDEGRKEELEAVQLPAILDNERAATTREATLVAALNAERARIDEIQKQVQRLAARAAGHN
jgi:hypothetical protein